MTEYLDKCLKEDKLKKHSTSTGEISNLFKIIDRDLTDESIQREIMDSVIEGWRLEIRGLVEDENRKDWDAEKGNRHMEIYSRKRIVAHSDSLSSHMAEDKIKKIREK